MKQNSWYRHCSQQLREAREGSEKYLAAERERNGKIHDAPGRVRRNQQRMLDMFDALKAGDSLEAFGIQAVVKRKNRKSVSTTTGTRYTVRELTGTEGQS